MMFLPSLFLAVLTICNGQSLEDVCGISKYPDAGRVPVEAVGARNKRIVGGVAARPNEYPWMVMMDWRNSNGVWDQNCGGVLIDNRWVLSARHCTYANDPEDDYELYLKNHLRLPNDGVSYVPEVIVRHPDYDSDTYENDIVMFKLPVNVTFDADLRPICLPPRGDNNTYVGQRLILAGWGNEERNAPSPEQLLYTDLTVISNDQCAEGIAPRPVFTDREYCVQGQLKDSGDGDSGGPYFFQRPDGKFMAIGLQSWGYWPAGTRPSVLVKISAFYDWIDQVRANN